jgi:hypothetical protein
MIVGEIFIALILIALLIRSRIIVKTIYDYPPDCRIEILLNEIYFHSLSFVLMWVLFVLIITFL